MYQVLRYRTNATTVIIKLQCRRLHLLALVQHPRSLEHRRALEQCARSALVHFCVHLGCLATLDVLHIALTSKAYRNATNNHSKKLTQRA